MLEPLQSVRKADALDMLKQVQTALEADDVNSAAEQLQRLQKHMTEWQRSVRIRTARDWLDDALGGELLAFDTERAKAQIAAWRAALPDGNIVEVDAYETRITEQARRKQEAIHVRGVTAHCDELLRKATELETGSAPPNPQFVLDNYYIKARDIAAAARGEITSSPELDVLHRRAEQLFNHKTLAAQVYPMALEDHKFTEALSALEQLPADMPVPRFVMGSESGTRRSTFTEMTQLDAARSEIRQQAQAWAQREADMLMNAAQQALDAHEPEEALDTLESTERLDSLLDADTLIRLNDLRQRATTVAQGKQRAAQLVQQSQISAAEDDLAAWETYTQAQAIYQWLDELPAAREAIVKAMRRKLERTVQQADRAFNEQRDMERVRDLVRQGKAGYTGKDDSLQDMLDQLDEYHNMTERYDEYMQTATSLYQQVRELIWDDAVAANDMLTQLESYPDIVLEAFPELYDTRQQVNERLSADTLYSELYRSLFEQEMDTARGSMEKIQAAAEDYPGDNRFPVLRDALNMHLYFLRAQQQLHAGQTQDAAEALRAIAAVNGHPDQAQARQLLEQIALPPADAVPEDDEA